MLPSGASFAGYTVLERLARGGMADIYVVRDTNGQMRILRALLPQFRFNWRSVRRFRWGCEVLEKLDHSNVLHLFEQGKFKGQRYAILEYATGGNLRQRIIRRDPMLVTEHRKLLAGMAAGLAHIHKHGFLHLDFKPENVLLTADSQPKITDLDLSIPRPASPQRISRLSGTFAYLAPEQILSQPVDERADIFAFGVTAYEMLSGRKPVTGDSHPEMARKYAHFEEHLKPLRTYAPDIPASIERVVHKCLEKNPVCRYPAMEFVIRDLKS
jgi:serine/threonine-protein kinase